MEYLEDPRRHGGCLKFLSDFRALFIKTLRLAIRRPGQTTAEILLAYTFLGFLLGMRYILDRRSYAELILPSFRPQDALQTNGTGNVIYYYPGRSVQISSIMIEGFVLAGNICASTIVNSTVIALRARWPDFPSTSKFDDGIRVEENTIFH